MSPDENGLVTEPIYNCSPLSVEIDRNQFIGVVENATTREIREINPRYLSAVAAEREKKRQKEQLTEEKKKFIFENVNLTVPDKFKSDYLAVMLKNHECISRHKFDLGRTETLLQEISLKSEEPVYVKQFRIPDAHREEVEKHVNEWLKMGVVQPCRSKFKLLDELLARLVTHNVKINLQKCFFGSRNVAYLGFRLTEEGVKPGTDKLKAVSKATPPASVHEIRQFLGLCNFFRTHVRNFAQLTAPLTMLTRKDCKWKGGALPPLALTAFKELQTYLCSEPVVAYPRRDQPYALITDTSLGIDQQPGGLGAILTQINKKGEHCVIAYASRKLQKHKANYTPFLLEMQAAL